MPTQETVYRCLIISPSDVTESRDAIEGAITAWNAHVGRGLKTRVEAVRWESHSVPEMGGHPQSILNRQLVDECDLGVALFWTRLGTPTAAHESGSAEEIARLLQKGSRVLVYFCNAPIPQSSLRDEQYPKLQELKKRYMNEGLLQEFSTPSDLQAKFPLHLTSVISALLTKERAAGTPVPSSGTLTAPTPDIRVVMRRVFVIGPGNKRRWIQVDVQNHSPVNFYLSGINFELTSGGILYPPRDALTGRHQTPVLIEPGNTHQFFADPEEILEEAKTAGGAVACAVALDKIDRKFRTLPGQAQEVLDQIKSPSISALRSSKEN